MMRKERMEAFSDGVIAILITVMVLQLAVPRGADLAALVSMTPVLLTYLLSFVFLAIYWNNHHHLLQAAERVDGRVLWANLHLLFWLSLFPFATAWLGAYPSAPWPVAVYGLVLLLAGIAYYLLTRALIALHGRDSLLAAAVGRDVKGLLSLLTYLGASFLAFASPRAAEGLYALVALIWLIPDRRIEKQIAR